MADLTNGEKDLLVRSLRYYISCERSAIQTAALAAQRGSASDVRYAETVKREAGEHVTAAEALIEKLRPDFKTST